jgi:hypothetical protein
MRWMAVGLLLVALGACTSSGLDPDASPDLPGATQDEGDEAARRDAVFLTAVEQVLAGTVHDGLVDAIPGELLLGATTICARLDAGDAPEDVLVVYLDALGAEGGQPSVEDGQLAGSLLGAAVAVYCDHHEAALPAG